MLALLLVMACERDPTLIGYWEVAAMRAGASEDLLDEVTLAGTMEFTADSTCAAIFSYEWSGSWQPQPQPDVMYLMTDAGENDDFVDSYKKRGETYKLNLWLTSGGDSQNTFDLVDWKGSTVTLVGQSAMPPGQWEVQGSRMIWELDLER
jgi:hypothetical protein